MVMSEVYIKKKVVFRAVENDVDMNNISGEKAEEFDLPGFYLAEFWCVKSHDDNWLVERPVENFPKIGREIMPLGRGDKSMNTIDDTVLHPGNCCFLATNSNVELLKLIPEYRQPPRLWVRLVRFIKKLPLLGSLIPPLSVIDRAWLYLSIPEDAFEKPYIFTFEHVRLTGGYWFGVYRDGSFTFCNSLSVVQLDLKIKLSRVVFDPNMLKLIGEHETYGSILINVYTPEYCRWPLRLEKKASDYGDFFFKGRGKKYDLLIDYNIKDMDGFLDLRKQMQRGKSCNINILISSHIHFRYLFLEETNNQDEDALYQITQFNYEVEMTK